LERRDHVAVYVVRCHDARDARILVADPERHALGRNAELDLARPSAEHHPRVRSGAGERKGDGVLGAAFDERRATRATAEEERARDVGELEARRDLARGAEGCKDETDDDSDRAMAETSLESGCRGPIPALQGLSVFVTAPGNRVLFLFLAVSA